MVINNNSLRTPGEGTSFPNATILVTCNKTGNTASCVSTGHQELLQRVTVPYAACIQLCPPEDEHLMLETCTGE